jgi:hypothetical protein
MCVRQAAEASGVVLRGWLVGVVRTACNISPPFAGGVACERGRGDSAAVTRRACGGGGGEVRVCVCHSDTPSPCPAATTVMRATGPPSHSNASAATLAACCSLGQHNLHHPQHPTNSVPAQAFVAGPTFLKQHVGQQFVARKQLHHSQPSSCHHPDHQPTHQITHTHSLLLRSTALRRCCALAPEQLLFLSPQQPPAAAAAWRGRSHAAAEGLQHTQQQQPWSPRAWRTMWCWTWWERAPSARCAAPRGGCCCAGWCRLLVSHTGPWKGACSRLGAPCGVHTSRTSSCCGQ